MGARAASAGHPSAEAFGFARAAIPLPKSSFARKRESEFALRQHRQPMDSRFRGNDVIGFRRIDSVRGKRNPVALAGGWAAS